MKWTTTGANQKADPCRAAARHHHIVLYVKKEQSFKDTEKLYADAREASATVQDGAD